MIMRLTTEQATIQDAVREAAHEEVRPAARRADSFLEPIWETLAEVDLTGLTTPTEYGGFNADRLSYALVNEELAAGSLSVATALSVHRLACSCIASFARESVCEEWLPEMSTSRPVRAFALSEPEAGSNPAEMSTTARRADKEWVLDGEKQWITNGQRSGIVIVFAQTDAGVTQFLVPKDTPGLSVGPKEDKLGLRASDTTPLALDSVRVSDRYRLTEPGRGLSAALEVLTGGRIGNAAQPVCLGQAAYEHAQEYAGNREQVDQPIGEFQSTGTSWPRYGRPSRPGGCRPACRPPTRARRGRPCGREHGQVLREQGRDGGHGRARPEPRGLRVHHRVPRQAALPRRKDHDDLRGHSPDPEDVIGRDIFGEL